MVSRLVVTFAVGVFMLAGPPVYAGVDPGDLCKETKSKAAGKKAFDLMKAFGKNQKKPDAAKLVSDILKAQSRFTRLFVKAEDKGGCETTGDVDDVEVAVDNSVECVISVIGGGPCGCEGTAFPASGQTTAHQADRNDGNPGAVDVPDDGVVQAGAPLAYMANPDGTITDLNTGLMWEKKSDDGGLHDVDNSYVWSGNGVEETIWDWLDDVNAQGGTGFAGYSDWRIPNAKELQSIVNYRWFNPPVDPIFNTGCAGGCTVTECSCIQSDNDNHWTSTSRAGVASFAWTVAFDDGSVFPRDKGTFHYVRAVRGGLLSSPSSAFLDMTTTVLD